MKYLNWLSWSVFLAFLVITGCREHHSTLSVFPLKHYDQRISTWIQPDARDYDKPFLSHEAQLHHLTLFYAHQVGRLSPWNAKHVNKILHTEQPDDLFSIETNVKERYSNQNKPVNEIEYGENFRPHTQQWINSITENININQFRHLHYNANQRGIAIDNLYARALPTDDVSFYRYTIPGQGYPFDNLQISALWAGTPVYILGETNDRAWSLILTPDYIAWVKSAGIARAHDAFINQWRTAAQHLIAITQTQTSIIDNYHVHKFTAYVGSVFPGQALANQFKILIPAADLKQQATIHTSLIPKSNGALMPLTATPHHMSIIMRTLLGRPYGWGNMYFYNDCSAELKSLFTPFGVWLPRHSAEQVEMGRLVDLSDKKMKDRLAYLRENGRPFATLIYVGEHIMLYIGTYPHAQNNSLVPMTYQNMWGLKPSPSPSARAVIGKSVFFPLLERYPENPNLVSQANRKYFQISEISEPEENLKKLEIIDLIALTAL